MIRGLIITIIFYTSIDFLEAQNSFVIGKILDAQTKSPVPYVAIVFKNTSYRMVSDSAGEFKLPENLLLNDTVIFSCLAYESKKVATRNISPGKPFIVFLKYKEYSLPQFAVIENVAKQYLKKAISKLPENYSPKPYILSAFYRQYHIENKKAVRLIESYQNIAYAGLAKEHNYTVKTKIKTLRRSDNNEMNKEQHGDHLFDILLEDPVVNSAGTVLNLKALEYYQCELDSVQPNDSLLKIVFKAMNYNQDFINSGSIILNRKDFSVISYQSMKTNNPYSVSKRKHFVAPYTWQFVKADKTYMYTKTGDYYHLQDVQFNYRHKLINAQNGNIDYTVEEFFELYCDKDIVNEICDNTYKKYSGLYTYHYVYDKNLWKSKATKGIPEKIFNDLSAQKELELQFKENE